MRVPREDLRVPDAEADIYLVGLGIGGFERRTVEAHNILSDCGFIAHLTAFDDAIRANYQADVYDLGIINASSDDPSFVYQQITEAIIVAHRNYRIFGPIALVVHGHPLWLVSSAWELLEKTDIRVKVVPGTTFIDQIIGDLAIRMDRGVQVYEASIFHEERITPDTRYPLVLSQFGEFASSKLRPSGDTVSRMRPMVERLQSLYRPERMASLILSPWRGDMEPRVTSVPIRDLSAIVSSAHPGVSLVVHGEEK